MRSAPIRFRRQSARPAKPRSGFTLIELLMALVITGLLSTVIFEVLRGQGRFASFVSAREEVQQNGRAALDLMSSELRGIAEFGITAASANSITFWSPQEWALACVEAGGGLVAAYPSGAAPSFVGGENVDLSVRVTSGNGASISFVTGTVDLTTRPADTPACQAALVSDPVLVERQVVRFAGAATGASAGDRLHVHEQVTYSLGAAADVAGTWLLRNGQPVAGPIPANGLVFSYSDSNSGNLSGATQTERDQIVSIQLSVITNSRARIAGTTQANSGSTTVYLRNRVVP